jgi:SAM-dependent methyltransferase
MSGYVLAHGGDEREAERMELLDAYHGPLTVSQIDAAGVGPGWRCLEVGAGAGWMTRRLAQRVRPGGRVLAIDLETHWLEPLRDDVVDVRRGDITTATLEPGGFDLVLAQMLLLHLGDPAAPTWSTSSRSRWSSAAATRRPGSSSSRSSASANGPCSSGPRPRRSRPRSRRSAIPPVGSSRRRAGSCAAARRNALRLADARSAAVEPRGRRLRGRVGEPADHVLRWRLDDRSPTFAREHAGPPRNHRARRRGCNPTLAEPQPRVRRQ